MKCHWKGGLRARGSSWGALLVIDTSLNFVDLNQASIDGSLVLELLRCSGWLALGGAKVAADLSLSGSRFEDADRDCAVDLTGSMVAGEIHARDLHTKGELRADHARIGSDFKLAGATLDDSHSTPAVALNLADAHVGGQVALTRGERRFEARGLIVLAAAELGSFVAKASLLDGRGRPAILGDQVTVRHLIDLSGLTAEAGEPFEAVGAVQLSSGRIGGQIQIYDASIEADQYALNVHGTSIGGDLQLGFQGTTTTIGDGVKADTASIGGALRCEALNLRSSDAALSLRQARVGKDIALYDVKARGSLRFDDTEAGCANIQGCTLTRFDAVARQEGMPDNYAHGDDTLLDFTFATLRSDLRLERVSVERGDIRLNGARIGTTVQLIIVKVTPEAKHALLAQDAKVEGGFQIAGAEGEPSTFAGHVVLMGAHFGNLSFAGVHVGSSDKPADVLLTGASAESIIVQDCEFHGSINAIACRVTRDLQLNSSRFLNPGNAAIDLRRAEVGGELQFGTARNADPIRCEIEGLATAAGAQVGALSWRRVRLLPNTKLDLTNISVKRQMEVSDLIGEEPSQLDLGGTTTPLLIDKIDEDQDSWGAGKIRLGLDNFRYDRLESPSGSASDEASVVRRRRMIWLARRYDDRSARPGRHLARVLREQGLFEASRLTMLDAFAAEGRDKPSWLQRCASRTFGLLFGYGLSGRRALITLLSLWLIGAVGLIGLDDRHMLVSGSSADHKPCPQIFDPGLAAADLMIPIVDFGQERICVVGAAPGAKPREGFEVAGWRLFDEEAAERTGIVLFEVIGWVILSLAIATWSGLFRRGGRE